MTSERNSTIDEAGQQLIARAVAVVGITGVGLIHLLDVIGKFNETPYRGWMYVGLILGCLATAGGLIWGNIREAWVASLLLPLMAMAGFILTRTVGLPQAMDDIGNWAEPLGLASLFVEGCMVVLSGITLAKLAPASVLSRQKTLVTA